MAVLSYLLTMISTAEFILLFTGVYIKPKFGQKCSHIDSNLSDASRSHSDSCGNESVLIQKCILRHLTQLLFILNVLMLSNKSLGCTRNVSYSTQYAKVKSAQVLTSTNNEMKCRQFGTGHVLHRPRLSS